VKGITEFVLNRNPVWVVPLALPLVLYGSGSVEQAVLFVMLVGIGVPVIHMVSFFAERWLPRMFRLVPVLIVAGTVFTVFEMVFLVPAEGVSERLLLMVRGASVSGIVIVPTIGSPEDERFIDRMRQVAGLTVGFVLGFVLFTAIRLGFTILVGRELQPVALGFFVLALGRIAWNAAHLDEVAALDRDGTLDSDGALDSDDKERVAGRRGGQA